MRRAALIIGVLAAAGCGSQSQSAYPVDVAKADQADADQTTIDPAMLTALLPQPAGRFAPSHMTVAGTPHITGRYIAKPETCGNCHSSVMAQWDTSAHSFASFSNPIYRAVIDAFRKAKGNRASQFCGGCHDIALQTDGALARAVTGTDLRAHAGVTCQTCHGIESVSRDGNGSYTLSGTPLALPNLHDKASIAAHMRQVSRRRLSDRLCVSCHRSFLSAATGNATHLVGMDDFNAWQSSGFGGNGAVRVDKLRPRTCIGCHMKKEKAVLGDRAADAQGRVHSHRFLGGHTWLAAMRGDADALRRNQKFLHGIASIDIAAIRDDTGKRTLLADGAPATPGRTLTADVVVRNLSVGHRFPGGVLDTQDAWIELTVRDARNKLVASAGRGHARRSPDDSTHVFSALVADAGADIRHIHEVNTFMAKITDHTIGPRDAVVARFSFAVPRGVQQPLRLEARLLHRTRNLRLQRAACAAHRKRRGQIFARKSKLVRGVAVDPCVAQPITEIARTSAAIGRGWKTVQQAAKAPRWRRLYEHGMALLHSVQEQLAEAEPSLTAALVALRGRRGTTAAFNRAMVYTALGKLRGRQGRTDEALAILDKAEHGAPGHPAIDAARAAALMLVWRWKQAVPPLVRCSHKAPGNLGVWRALAIARGSSGDDAGALEAAKRGLALAPRDADLLRVQALSLRRLGAPEAITKPALEAYASFRRPDRGSDIRIACAAKSAACARERNPVHVHRMIQK